MDQQRESDMNMPREDESSQRQGDAGQEGGMGDAGSDMGRQPDDLGQGDPGEDGGTGTEGGMGSGMGGDAETGTGQ